jgi:hypothetical protein
MQVTPILGLGLEGWRGAGDVDARLPLGPLAPVRRAGFRPPVAGLPTEDRPVGSHNPMLRNSSTSSQTPC